MPTPAPLPAASSTGRDAVAANVAPLGPAVGIGGGGGPAVASDGEERQEELGVTTIGVAVGILIGVVALPGQVDGEVAAGVRPCLLEDPDVGVGVLVDVGVGVSDRSRRHRAETPLAAQTVSPAVARAVAASHLVVRVIVVS